MHDAPTSHPPPDETSSPGEARVALLRLVLERGYERRAEPFQLSSGGWSRDYVDMRRAVARGGDLETAARAVIARAGELGVEFDAIGGMTMGADPVAHAVALLSGREWFSVRKAVKSHGRQQRVEGAVLAPGRRVILFEDTVSTGGSILEAAEVVAGTGAQIVLACTLLDRGDDARRSFEAQGIDYEAILGYSDLGLEPLHGGSSSG
jgi:orotate phosphoribosyltransferase